MKKSVAIGIVAGAAATVAAGVTAVVLIAKKKNSEKETLSNSLNSLRRMCENEINTYEEMKTMKDLPEDFVEGQLTQIRNSISLYNSKFERFTELYPELDNDHDYFVEVLDGETGEVQFLKDSEVDASETAKARV